jgi:hypothetical protein
MLEKKIKKIEKMPEDLKLSYLEILIMPNGELLCKGKRIGYFKDFKDVIWETFDDSFI